MESNLNPVIGKMTTGLHMLGANVLQNLGRDWTMMAESQSPDVLEGFLTTQTDKIVVEVRYATMHSLWVELNWDRDTVSVENLVLRVGDKLVEIGPCYVSPEETLGGGVVRLIPFQKILDLDQLFFRKQIDIMDTRLTSLSQTLEYKKGINSEFSAYVTEMSYDLNSYMVLLDQLDVQSYNEPALILDIIQANIIEKVGPGFRDYMLKKSDELNALVLNLSETEQGHHGYYFRRQMWNILLRSPFLSRSNLKPRGYNGDSEMMQMIYHNTYEGDSTFGKLLHKYSVDQEAAQAVRNRRKEISALLLNRIKKSTTSLEGKLKILSVACGPAFEIQDILQTTEDCNKLQIFLLDQDDKALIEAATLVSKIEKKLGTSISAQYIKESVRTMHVDNQIGKQWGQFDFIYSMGLFDYLNDSVATSLISYLFHLLGPNGEMIIGNMEIKNPSKNYMAYWHDWKIILRSKSDFLRMASALPNAEVDVTYDETGIQMMLHIKKGGNQNA